MPSSYPKSISGLGNDQIRVLIEFAQDNGLTLAQTLANTHLTEADLANNLLSLSPDQELLIIQNIVSLVDDCPFRLGFKAGLQCKLHSFGLIGQSMLSSDTVKDALDIFSRFISKVFYFSSFEVNETQGRAIVTYSLTIPMNEIVGQFVTARDFGVTAYVHDLVMGKHSNRVFEIGLASPKPKGIDVLLEYFSCPIKFNTPQNYLIGDSRNLDLKMPYANPVTANILEQQCLKIIKQLDNSEHAHSTIKKVGKLLAQTGNFNMTREQAALMLNMSTRTLTRRLQEEHTSWRKVVAELRIRKACQLLKFSDLSIQCIADDIGFSSASAFTTAFARDKGHTPLEYRNRFKSKKPETICEDS